MSHQKRQRATDAVSKLTSLRLKCGYCAEQSWRNIDGQAQRSSRSFTVPCCLPLRRVPLSGRCRPRTSAGVGLIGRIWNYAEAGRAGQIHARATSGWDVPTRKWCALTGPFLAGTYPVPGLLPRAALRVIRRQLAQSGSFCQRRRRRRAVSQGGCCTGVSAGEGAIIVLLIRAWAAIDRWTTTDRAPTQRQPCPL